MYLNPGPSGAWPNNEPPPTVLQAEMLLLSALIHHGGAARALLPQITAEQFAEPAHSRIFAALVVDRTPGQVADLATLTTEFQGAGVLDDVGGTPYLTQLVGVRAALSAAPDMARFVTDAWLRRQLVDLGETLGRLAFGNGGLSGAETLALAEKRIADLRAVAGASR
jgi:replicative DNA helicase